jgi:hypothetical protein
MQGKGFKVLSISQRKLLVFSRKWPYLSVLRKIHLIQFTITIIIYEIFPAEGRRMHSEGPEGFPFYPKST